MTSPSHPVFNPTDVAPQALDDITVGRENLLRRITDRLTGLASSGSRPHTLIVGPRGSGKTHLMAVALHRAQQDESFRQRVLVLALPEDAPGIQSYPDLLVALARQVSMSTGQHAITLRRQRDTIGLQRLILDAAAGRVLVFAMENLDRIFTSLSDAGQRGLRGFIETSGQIALFATTPTLFAAISTRSEPFFGAFDAEHLTDLDLAAGTELVRRAAMDRNDVDLAAFVVSPIGQNRLRALERLTGGSPRLWHVLAGTVTIETLDVLIPAVRTMLDRLTPYYQQRLWSLTGHQDVLVTELARQPGALTATALSELVGIDRATTVTTLKRLAEDGWVRAAKVPGTDQRTTWFDVREPLLRHYMSYRESGGGPLELIVTILGAWFSREERLNWLARIDPGSPSELHLIRTLAADPPHRSDSFYADRDPEALLAAARCWIAGSSAIGGIQATAELGLSIEQLVTEALGRPVPNRGQDPSAPDGVGMSSIGDAMTELARRPWTGDDRDLVDLVAACWNGERDPVSARDRLDAVVARRGAGADDLTLLAREEFAFYTGAAGAADVARDLLADLIHDRTRILGPDHPDTLNARGHHALLTGEAGNPTTARDLHAALIHDRTRILGPDHPDTLTTRHNHADWTGTAGNPSGARDLYAVLVHDRTRILGPDHPDTLNARGHHAHWTGTAGNPSGARDLHAALTHDYARVLGPDHRNTLSIRMQLAHWTAESGERPAALQLFENLVTDTLDVDSAADIEAMATALWVRRITELAAGWPQLSSLLGPDRTGGAVARELARPRTTDDLMRIAASLPNEPWAGAALVTAVFAHNADRRSREAVVAAAISVDDAYLVLPRQVIEAMDGVPEALASLPAEMRDLITDNTARLD